MTLSSWLLPLFVLTVLCLLLAGLLRRRSGLPDGEIVYEDAGGDARVLVSPRYGLRGKPDYLLADGAGGVIPVELKSGLMPRSGRAYRSHVMQLAVYFLLVEEVLRKKVAYGLVRYQNGSLRIENTERLREELMDLVEEMRAALADDDALRNHNQASRCRACSMAYACDERLA